MRNIGICCNVNMCESVSCYDFFEFPASEIASMSVHEFKQLKSCSYSVPVMNRLFPSTMKLVERIDLNKIRSYTKLVLERGIALGTTLFVLGSGKSRSFTREYPKQRALQDLGVVCFELDNLAQEYGVKIAIEPLCNETSNLLISLRETHDFLQKNQFRSIKMIADAYHMFKVDDDYNDLTQYASFISHIHLCDERRGFMCSQSEYILKLLDVAANLKTKVSWSVEVNQIESEQAPKLYNFLKEY